MTLGVPACIPAFAIVLDPNAKNDLSSFRLRSSVVRVKVCHDKVATLRLDAADLIRVG
jgi:hypothetical protein